VAQRGYLSIGEVLTLLKPEFADLTISKIRFLESQGLLDPERTPSGYRKFYGPDVERLRWILRQQHENYLPLKVIKGKLGTDPESADPWPEDLVEVMSGQPTAGVTRANSHSGAHVQAAPETSSAGPRRMANPELGGPPSGVSLTIDELVDASGLSSEDLAELVRFGLMVGKTVAGTVYYDEEALTVAQLAAGFMRYGVEARHLRMYRTSAEREAAFFEQVVMPMLKQRNPQARKQALEALVDLSQLGEGLRAAMLRQALRDSTGT
jgi:DNA-binding transcriptional MerR regulator